MIPDSEIGRVIAVDTAEVTIELGVELKTLTRTTYEGTHEVGRINSYVIMPVGARRLVGIVSRVSLLESAELGKDAAAVTLPKARRLMRATLIGTVDGNSFTQGVSIFPVLDNPVHLVAPKDLEVIFDSNQDIEKKEKDKEAGFCVSIGESAVFEGFQVRINPDLFFGKHAGVLGSTGSGKSCTIAAVLQAIFDIEAVRHTHIIILDTNGEYGAAFRTGGGTSACLYIPTDDRQKANRLVIPYWFMDSADFVRLFRASQGVQRPVLLEALRLARNEGAAVSPGASLREELILELNRLWSLAGKDEKSSKDVRDLADGLLKRLEGADLEAGWKLLGSVAPELKKDAVRASVSTIKAEASKHVDSGTYPKVIPADSRKVIRDAMEPAYVKLTGVALGEVAPSSGISADSPAFFDKVGFRTRHLEQVLRREESGGARARDFSGTMLLRIDRLLEDSRFEFLLGPRDSQLPNAEHALASFIRDVLGLASRDSVSPPLSSKSEVEEGVMPFYDRQRMKTKGANIVILDLSLLASEVLENVTALIGRLVIEFLQRLGEYEKGPGRGALPVVMVLEEAQNYIRQTRPGDEDSISKLVFERIAREGRKFGLGLLLASQRPSELSRTVLSQCSSFVVHRLQNPEDLRYFREIVPAIYGPLLEQLPALAPQTALVLGDCVRAPSLVKIREARPVPRSRDPKFYSHWTEDEVEVIPVEEVCALWEGDLAVDSEEKES